MAPNLICKWLERTGKGDWLGVFLLVRGWSSHILVILVWFELAPKVGSIQTLLWVCSDVRQGEKGWWA